MILIYLPNELSCFSATNDDLEFLRKRLPYERQKSLHLSLDEEDFIANLPRAETVIVWRFRQEWFALAPHLRHIYTPSAGRDYFQVEPPPAVTMHYGNFHGTIMGETALACILAVTHGILPFATTMTKGTNPWPRQEITSSKRIALSTVAILGFGNIGQAFAKMLMPFGAKIIGITRTTHPELATKFPTVELATIDELDSVLPEIDHLVCILPSGKETTDLIDANRIALMKDTAYIYNFGRGNLIDEDALVKALHNKKLGGAVLDVFKTEPLPDSSPLRSAPNCYLYPHSSAFSPDYLKLYFEKIISILEI